MPANKHVLQKRKLNPEPNPSFSPLFIQDDKSLFELSAEAKASTLANPVEFDPVNLNAILASPIPMDQDTIQNDDSDLDNIFRKPILKYHEHINNPHEQATITDFLVEACLWTISEGDGYTKEQLTWTRNITTTFYSLLKKYSLEHYSENAIFIFYYFRKMHQAAKQSLSFQECPFYGKERFYYQLFYTACLLSIKYLHDEGTRNARLPIPFAFQKVFNKDILILINHSPYDYNLSLSELNKAEIFSLELLEHQLFLNIDQEKMIRIPQKINTILEMQPQLEPESEIMAEPHFLPGYQPYKHLHNLQKNRYENHIKELNNLMNSLTTLEPIKPCLNLTF